MQNGKFDRWSASGLRTRYFPKSRIAQGFISIAPVVNIMLLLIFFSMLNFKMMLKPGVAIDLPRSPFKEGAHQGAAMLVVLSVPSVDNGGREEIVFFNDVRYKFRNEDQVQQLRMALAERRLSKPDLEIIIQADQKVLHGTIVKIMDCALEAGVGKVIIATRPEAQEKK